MDLATQFQQQFVFYRLPKTSRLLLAVSGGVDSMVLLHLMQQTIQPFAVAHCNFGLREQVQQEAELVKQACEQANIPFHYKEMDTEKYAEQHGVSIQMAARALRYAWFAELQNEHNYKQIVTAHHANDNNETVLLNIVKGTGIRGMVGIAENTEQVLRPLLFATKQQIIDYAEQNNIRYLNDESNASNKYQRNFIRNVILPQLKEINPAVEQTLQQTIQHHQFAFHLFQQQLKKLKSQLIHHENGGDVIFVNQLLAQPFALQLLHELLLPYGANQHLVEQVFDVLSNSTINNSEIYETETHQLIKVNNRLLIRKKSDSSIYALIHEGEKLVSVGQCQLQIQHEQRAEQLQTNKNEILVAADALEFPLVLRQWQAGDYFYPFGLNKKKKVSKFLINEKVNKVDKEKVLVLCSGQKIVWVVGLRADHRFRVTDKTKSVVLFRLK